MSDMCRIEAQPGGMPHGVNGSAPYLHVAVILRQSYTTWHDTCASKDSGVWTNLGVNVGGEVIGKEVVISAQDAADKGLEVVLPAEVP